MFQNSCWKVSKQGTDGVRTRDLRFTRPTPYHLATAPDKCAFFWLQSTPFFPWILFSHGREFEDKKKCGSGGIRTHASEETGALNQRLRPLGHATSPPLRASKVLYEHSFWLSKCQGRKQGPSSRSLWRNWLARSAVNRKVAGSSPAGGDIFCVFTLYICKAQIINRIEYCYA